MLYCVIHTWLGKSIDFRFINCDCSIFSEWRIATKLHTINQTLVGAGIGFLVGWFFISRERMFQRMLSNLMNEEDDVKFPMWVKVMLVLLGVLILLVDSTRKSKMF